MKCPKCGWECDIENAVKCLAPRDLYTSDDFCIHHLDGKCIATEEQKKKYPCEFRGKKQ